MGITSRKKQRKEHGSSNFSLHGVDTAKNLPQLGMHGQTTADQPTLVTLTVPNINHFAANTESVDTLPYYFSRMVVKASNIKDKEISHLSKLGLLDKLDNLPLLLRKLPLLLKKLLTAKLLFLVMITSLPLSKERTTLSNFMHHGVDTVRKWSLFGMN